MLPVSLQGGGELQEAGTSLGKWGLETQELQEITFASQKRCPEWGQRWIITTPPLPRVFWGRETINKSS